jgi:hypothetical protein
LRSWSCPFDEIAGIAEALLMKRTGKTSSGPFRIAGTLIFGPGPLSPAGDLVS